MNLYIYTGILYEVIIKLDKVCSIIFSFTFLIIFYLISLALFLVFLLLMVSSVGCRSDSFDKPVVLGGVEISAAVLNQGEDVYGRYCARCHGSRGRVGTRAS